ncbi:MAG: hypothetical protein IPM56_01110 [Ignavibacteriales bacterium]|nr:MAG: hypothetical protein IPM56_01110 [Ignavibacteriales bacterium]
MPETVDIKLKDADQKIDNLKSGGVNKFSVQSKREVSVIEMEDINFHFDSAVLLPDYGTEEPQPGNEEQNRITGLGVIFACFKLAEEKEFKQKILVAGHTDKSGGEFYNLTLSQQRAENVFFMMMGERTKWAESSNAKHQVEDIQQILKWISFNFRYDCDPGEKTNKMNAETTGAILAFQKRYNEDFVIQEKHKEKFTRKFIKLDEDGKMGTKTWGAFFDMYTLELLIVMGITEDALNEQRTKLTFVKKGQTQPAPVIGCGENFPASGATSEDPNEIDRRVEILFFDEGEEPELKCHPKKFQCIKSKCDLYPKDKFFKHTPVPVDPLPLPSGVAVRVHLKFIYKTPDEKERTFPKDFPYILKFQDGSTEGKKLEDDSGQVFLQILREKKSFTIEFKISEISYVATPDDETKKDILIKEPEVKGKVKEKFKVFNLPQEWNLKNTKWELSPAVSNFDNTEKQFKDLDNLSVENIGSEASPIKMILDPKWQFIKFLYFDRFVKKKLSIPPALVEGFSLKSDATFTTRSNWFTKDEGCQCLPWIIQTVKKPDANSLLKLRSAPNTFIETTGDESNFTRKYVTKSPPASADAGLNEGEGTGVDLNQPNEKRLAFYDMPAIWKSTKYFAKLSGGTGAAPTKEDVFENIVFDTTTNQKPLLISLDDIVLTDKDLKPITVDQNERIAIFSNLFGKDPANSDVSELGIFKPDTSEPYFSQKVERVKNNINYIADYPDWTRLVVYKGNLFESFDQRTVEGKGDIVGARAAVRWVDATNQTTDGVGKTPGNSFSTRPSPVIKSFFVEQPFLQQEYIHKLFSLDAGSYNFMTTPDIPSGNRGKTSNIGRFDRAFLRCCDVKDGKEFSVILEYYRFSFDFSNAPDSLKNSAAKKSQYKKDTCINIGKRWSQKDGTLNPGPAEIESKEDSLKLNTKVMWLAQSLDNSLAHFKLDVVSDDGRSFMASFDGTAELRISANKDEGGGKLVAAHECGHGGSLPDEYIESSTLCSYNQTPLRSNNLPGDFFDLDGRAMMISNKQIRARYYWHVAEWMRSFIDGKYIVKHDTFKYEVQPHPNNNKSNRKSLRTFTNWPRTANVNTDIGKNKFSVFFYLLGEDTFSTNIVKPGTTFKGNVLVMIHLKFKFPETPSHTPDGTFGRINEDINKLNTRLEKLFNKKFKASGKVDGTEFDPCIFMFSFRYLVETITNEDNDENKKYLKRNGGTKGKYNDLAESLEDRHDIHLKVEVIDPPTTKTSKIDNDKITLRSDEFNKFEKLVAQALGLNLGSVSGGLFILKPSLVPIVNKVMTDGKVDSL